ncbi:MAG: tRNA dihydrouridine synthase DusB [Planctomycetota bacterium]
MSIAEPTAVSPLPTGPLDYGPLRLATRFHLSPLAGFTNLPFRRIVRELGGLGLATTDLVNARGLLEGSRKSLELIETTPDDEPLAVQIFGHDPHAMAEAAKLLEGRGVISIDINMGCPVDRIVGQGAGSAMMKADPCATVNLVKAVVDAVSIPVTVKMRLGWDERHMTAPKFACDFESVGVVAVAIHGRTRAQGFTGTVDLDGIAAVVDAVDAIPVVGNGDVRTVADAERMASVTGCDAVSVGRGALANPWIFRQLHERSTTVEFGPSGTFDDRLDLLRKQFAFLAERHGPDGAVPRFRKMTHWYLKAMRVRKADRHRVQTAKTAAEFHAVIDHVEQAGPHGIPRTDPPPDMEVPVPSGPIAPW